MNSNLYTTEFTAAYRYILEHMWHNVKDELPELNTQVVVLTSNYKVAISMMYIPTDSYGNTIDNTPIWKGSYTFRNSIIAWMNIPPYNYPSI